VKRKPVIARCFVLRADRNDHTWYIAKPAQWDLSGRLGSTGLADHAWEFATLEEARAAKCEVVWPEWRIWRRGARR